MSYTRQSRDQLLAVHKQREPVSCWSRAPLHQQHKTLQHQTLRALQGRAASVTAPRMRQTAGSSIARQCLRRSRRLGGTLEALRRRGNRATSQHLASAVLRRSGVRCRSGAIARLLTSRRCGAAALRRGGATTQFLTHPPVRCRGGAVPRGNGAAAAQSRNFAHLASRQRAACASSGAGCRPADRGLLPVLYNRSRPRPRAAVPGAQVRCATGCGSAAPRPAAL